MARKKKQDSGIVKWAQDWGQSLAPKGYKPGDVMKPAQASKRQGVQGWADDQAQGTLGTARDIGNFFGSLGNFFSGSPQGKNGAGLGDVFVGSSRPNPKASPAQQAKSRPNQRQMAPVDNSQQAAPMGFQDYLDMANKLAGTGAGSAGVDYGALRAQLQANASAGDAKLGALYNSLANANAADAAGIGKNFDTAQQGTDAAIQAAQSSTNAGYDAAADDANAKMAALGITAPGSRDTQAQAANDQAVANSNLDQIKALGDSRMAQNKANALQYNTAVVQGSRGAGADARSQLQQQLASKLAELDQASAQQDAQQAQAAQQQKASNLDLAFKLMGNASAIDPNAPASSDDQIAQLKATNQYLQNQRLQQQIDNGGQSAKPNLQQLQKLAQQYGVDPSNMEDFTNFVKLYNMTQ